MKTFSLLLSAAALVLLQGTLGDGAQNNNNNNAFLEVQFLNVNDEIKAADEKYKDDTLFEVTILGLLCLVFANYDRRTMIAQKYKCIKIWAIWARALL